MIKKENMVFRKLQVIFIGIYSFLLFTAFRSVYAQVTNPISSSDSGGSSGILENPLSSVNSFPEFVSAVLNIVLKIGVPIAAVAIIYSGFLFLKAQGNDEELNTAKSALTWSVVGTAVLLGAWTFAEGIRATIDALR